MLIHCIKKAFSKKNILYVLLFVSLFFAFQDISFAAEAPNFETKTIDVMNTLLKIFGSLLGAITALVSIFLHPGWYNGQIFDLNIYLKDIWILMSNVVYFIFAFLLIFIAFMNIIGKEGAHQEYQLKSALPKFIVGVLIVPFTWFIVQFVLSISAILTVSVLALPFDTFKDYDFFTKMGSQQICVNYEIPLGKSLSGSTNASGTTPPQIEESIKCIGTKKSITDIVNSINGDGKTSDSIFGIVSIYTYGILGLEGLDTLGRKGIASGVTKIAHISLKMVFDIIFVIAYCLLMIALFLALFTRGVWLWVYTMMSPLFGLIYFFGDPHDETLKKFKFSEFIALAMVPVYVAAALSFGLVFIMVAGDGMRKSAISTDTTGKIMKCTPNLNDGPPNPNEERQCTITVGDFSFKISGSIGDNANIFGGALGALGTLIVQMFGLVILWLSVMAALHASKITEAAAGPIHHLGESIGSTAMKMPQYAPILPGGMSPKGLEDIGSKMQNYPNEISQKKTAEFMQKHNLFQNGAMDKVTQERVQTARNIVNSKDAGNLTSEDVKTISSSLGGIKDITTARTHYESKALVTDLAKKLKVDIKPDAFSDDKKYSELLGDIHNKLQKDKNLGLIGGKNIPIATGQMDDEVAAWIGKGNSNGGATPTSQTNNINFNSYKSAGSAEFEMSKYSTFMTELFNNNQGNTFTQNEFKGILSKSYTNADKIIQEINNKNKDFFKPETPPKQ